MGDGLLHFPTQDGPGPPSHPVAPEPSCDSCGLLAEADHRIANHLAMLSGFVRLRAVDMGRQANEPSRASVRLMMEGLGLQIDAVSRLHRALAAHGSGAPADLSVHLHEICAPFASGVFGSIVLVEDLPAKCRVQADQLLPLTQIFAEVLTNAVKHGCDGGSRGRVRVHGRQDEQGLVIEISDSGRGFPPAFDPETDGGLGFRLMRALSRQLGAVMVFDSTPRGLHFKLTLPATPA